MYPSVLSNCGHVFCSEWGGGVESFNFKVPVMVPNPQNGFFLCHYVGFLFGTVGKDLRNNS